MFRVKRILSEKGMYMTGFCIRFSAAHCINRESLLFRLFAATGWWSPVRFATEIQYNVLRLARFILEEQRLVIQIAADIILKVVKYVTDGDADVEIFTYINTREKKVIPIVRVYIMRDFPTGMNPGKSLSAGNVISLLLKMIRNV
jgi:hypothetical protein